MRPRPRSEQRDALSLTVLGEGLASFRPLSRSPQKEVGRPPPASPGPLAHVTVCFQLPSRVACSRAQPIAAQRLCSPVLRRPIGRPAGDDSGRLGRRGERPGRRKDPAGRAQREAATFLPPHAHRPSPPHASVWGFGCTHTGNAHFSPWKAPFSNKCSSRLKNVFAPTSFCTPTHQLLSRNREAPTRPRRRRWRSPPQGRG